MQLDFYKRFRQDIQDDLAKGKKKSSIQKAHIGSFNDDVLYPRKIRLMNRDYDKSLFESLSSLSEISGINAKYHEKPGSHPDFQEIRNINNVVEHYITSMFIDIKNSTKLFADYDPIAVANITTTIQRAAVHTCWYFDGYIQRFHGDGLMVYFGGKTKTIEESAHNAIMAASYFSYFMENDLKNLFIAQGIDDIYTRIGIDTGYDEDVIWYMTGMGDCSEITTCSLHTSLAFKVQQNAKNNGVMLGDNTKVNSAVDQNLFAIKKIDGKESRYIFSIPSDNFYYTQWEFDWPKFLRQGINSKFQEPQNLIVAPAIIATPQKDVNYLKSQVKDFKPSSFNNEI